MGTRDSLIARLEEEGLTLKKISAESGLTEKEIDRILSGAFSSDGIIKVLEEVTAAEKFFEKIFNMKIASIRVAWRNKKSPGSMKDFAKKHDAKIEM